MKKNLFFISLLLSVAFHSHAQTYGNEWINYNQTYFKFQIVHNGFYRIPYSTLQNFGVPVNTIPGSNYELYYMGSPTPIYVTTNNIFGASDYIEFYGKRNDGSLDSNLYLDKKWQCNVRTSLFNDTSTYFLTWSSTGASTHFNPVVNNIASHPPKEQYCLYTSEQFFGKTDSTGATNPFGPYPPYRDPYNTFSYGRDNLSPNLQFESDFNETEGYSDFYVDKNSPRTYSLQTPHLNLSGPLPQLSAALLGWGKKEHHLQITVNSNTLYNWVFYDWAMEHIDTTISMSWMGNVTDFKMSTAQQPTSHDYCSLSWVDLKYPRYFEFDNANVTGFALPGGGGSKYIEIPNFNEMGTNPILYDFTNKIRLEAIVQNDTEKFLLPPSATERKLMMVAYDNSLFNDVTALIPASFVNFADPANQGNFIIISHPKFFDDGLGNNYVNQYRLYKDSIGFNTKIENINQLYDEFAYGVRTHPLAIRNFSDYILAHWPQQDYYFLLVGKGMNYDSAWALPTLRDRFYIPTFGTHASDALLTATNADPTPRIQIGRLPCTEAIQVKDYLNKLREFIGAQDTTVQTIAADAYKKNIMHLAGGADSVGQSLFLYYLNSYKQIIEDTLYGGHVTTYAKSSTDPIQDAEYQFIDGTISSGLSLITFFGHSSNNSFDFNLDHPEDYHNYGKYPMFLTNGCLLGDVFEYSQSIPEQFVFAPGKGAISFLAPVTFSFTFALDNYSRNFYQNLGVNNYNQSIGKVLQATISDVNQYSVNTGDLVSKLTAEQFIYSGDPSLKLNTSNQPDYIIEESPSLSFIPTQVTAGLDSFDMQLIVYNVGKAINDSIYVDVKRHYPSGEIKVLYHRLVKAPYFRDTLYFKIATDGVSSFGPNLFDIKVDAGPNPYDWATNLGGDISEVSETNNTLLNELLVISAQDIVPVYPYEFGIVGNNNVTLKANTVDPFAASLQYVIQIDTTQLFNSPLFIEKKITQIGGVVSWTPPMSMIDSTVYYWRTAVDTTNAGVTSFTWHTTSFIYINGSSPGWNQSHYFQFLRDSLIQGNVILPPSRKWSFVADDKVISVYNGFIFNYGNGGLLQDDDPSYYINGVRMTRWAQNSALGLMYAVIDSASGLQWTNYAPGNFGSYCSTPVQYDYTYLTNTANVNPTQAQQSAASFMLNTVPDKDYILCMSWNDPSYSVWDQSLKNAFTSLGASQIQPLLDSGYKKPYVCFFKKNDPSYPFYEFVGDTQTSVIDTGFIISGAWDRGYAESVPIGPAQSWSSLHWHAHSLEPGIDSVGLQLIGVDASGNETLLSNNVQANDTLISGINTAQYPFLKLRLYSKDTTFRTPVQLDYWRINYQPYPDAALDPNAYFSLNTDSLVQFTPLNFGIGVTNVTPWDMDSMLMKFNITDASNGPHNFLQRYAPLPGNTTIHTDYSIPIDCDCYLGTDYLLIEANPSNDQIEQYHFNNLGIYLFKAGGDLLNPLLDVTFDGIHIMDNDIVSAKPDIVISLKDESKYLALSNDSLLKIYYLFPDGSRHDVVFDNATNTFYPADSQTLNKDNTAKAELKPVFPIDGKYQLVVQGYDRSGNASGNYDYRIGFEIINKPMISNILNYPNPFTTSTRFVFTLTGSEIPQYLRIQIMTIGGKVVREVLSNELGNLHIGTNITSFAWDGTDQYGDKLANGLYLYRVATVLNGKAVDHYDNGTDGYFKNGIGKMYLMR